MWRSGGRELQAEGTACVKGWRYTLAGYVLGPEERPVWPEQNEGGESSRR